jgi:hypothetical protein
MCKERLLTFFPNLIVVFGDEVDKYYFSGGIQKR